MGIEQWRVNPLGERLAGCIVSPSFFLLFFSVAWLFPPGKPLGKIKKYSSMENHLFKRNHALNSRRKLQLQRRKRNSKRI
jgi:hypothetical protein